jgi:3-hydroxybutyryl-CoA dehydrogenase
MTLESVVVVGFGTMGAGIVAACSAAGLNVTVVESDPTRLAAVPDGITARADIAAVAGAGLVIESVTEDEAAKLAVLRGAVEAAGPDVVLATSTSALSVTRLAAAVPGPNRVAGLHFFNPADRTPLVEVVRAVETDATTIATLTDFAERLGKHPIVVKDRPGFLVNALLFPYLNHAIREYDEGLAAAGDLDRAVELGLGYPFGPLKVLDRAGLDTYLAATDAVYAATRDSRYAPPPLLQQMVAAGRLGDKAGRGFVTGSDA